MVEIHQTPNFIVESHEQPFVTRDDGGHIRICIKDHSITDRTRLNPTQAVEFVRLTMLIGEAMELGLKDQGLEIVKINYQDMSNWAFKEQKPPFLHIHLFGRVWNAKFQIFPEAVYLPDRGTGFYDNFEPLRAGDILSIKNQISRLKETERYNIANWKNLNIES